MNTAFERVSLRPGIVCSDPTALSETFVRRHIEKLNGGDTIVVGECRLPTSPRIELAGRYSEQLLHRVRPRRAVRLLHRLGVSDEISDQIWHNIRGEAGLIDQSNYLLFEFGYLLARHYDYALFCDKPFFVYFRGQDASSLLREPAYVKTLIRVLPSARGVVFVSETLRRNLLAKGIALTRSAVIPSGVESEKFMPGPKLPHTALSVGRFVEKKAHDDTIRAFRLVVDRIPNFHLNLVGDGPLLQSAAELANLLNLGANISFLGALERKDVCQIMASSKYYIQSSKTGINGDSEGFPSAIQEALSSGCIVCSTRHSGASDYLVHQQTALLSEEGNFQEMAYNVLLSESSDILSDNVARQARCFAEAELDAEVCISRFEQFVYDCLRDATK